MSQFKSVKGALFESDTIIINEYNLLFFVGSESKYSSPKMMYIKKSITKGKMFKEYLRLKN